MQIKSKFLPMFGIGLTAFAGGLCNGLLGTGGGILLLYLLRKTIDTPHIRFLPPHADTAKDAYATVIICILPLSLLSVWLYTKNGMLQSLPISTVLPYFIGAIPGGLLGAWLLDHLKMPLIELLFSVLVLFAGIQMAF